jgi:hypothetical protein
MTTPGQSPVPQPERSVIPESLRDQFPGPEDWVALQGGKPRVFHNPHKPHVAWEVLHVYDEHDDEAKRFQSGIIVPTLPENTGKLLGKRVPRTIDGRQVMRDIIVPSFMDRTVHGDMCDERTAGYGGERYDRISYQREYEAEIARLIHEDYQELRFGFIGKGLGMIALPRIRPPRPLA